MNNFIFKSANRLIKNSSESLDDLIKICVRQLEFVLNEQRYSRADLQDIKRMLQKLLIDKHLQMQVDEYFTEDSQQDGSK